MRSSKGPPSPAHNQDRYPAGPTVPGDLWQDLRKKGAVFGTLLGLTTASLTGSGNCEVNKIAGTAQKSGMRKLWGQAPTDHRIRHIEAMAKLAKHGWIVAATVREGPSEFAVRCFVVGRDMEAEAISACAICRTSIQRTRSCCTVNFRSQKSR